MVCRIKTDAPPIINHSYNSLTFSLLLLQIMLAVFFWVDIQWSMLSNSFWFASYVRSLHLPPSSWLALVVVGPAALRIEGCGAISPSKPTTVLTDPRPTALPMDTIALVVPFADVGS